MLVEGAARTRASSRRRRPRRRARECSGARPRPVGRARTSRGPPAAASPTLSPVTATAKALRSAPLLQRPRARLERGVVQPGHEPDELVGPRAQRRHERGAVAGPDRARHAARARRAARASRPSSAKRANTPLALGPRSRSAAPAHDASPSASAPPRAAMTFSVAGAPTVAPPWARPRRRACRCAVVAGIGAGVVALHPHRPALALEPVEERLGEGAHDRRARPSPRPTGGSPTAPGRPATARTRRRPRSTPRRSRRRTSRAARRLRRPTDRRSTARSARRSGCPRRTSSAAAASPSGPRAPSAPDSEPSAALAEVARHAQLGAVALELLPGAEPAARGEGGAGEGARRHAARDRGHGRREREGPVAGRPGRSQAHRLIRA